jgi:acetylornithine deacetylase/succinyl-diaminopimelate desuccinylase-like protein
MKFSSLTLYFFALLSLNPSNVGAQTQIQTLLDSNDTKEIMAGIDAKRDWANHTLIEIGGIISPSGMEQDRANAVAKLMKEAGLSNVRVTESPNVIGHIPGRSGKALIFVSTLDDLATVADFQRAAQQPPHLDGNRIVGPGTNTSLTTVAMLTAAAELQRQGIKPEHDLVFAAVAQEETGLKGMRALYESYRDRAIGFVDVLGDGESISYGALGIHWWKVVATGPAGHTLRGGLPNVNQGIGRAVDRIMSLPEPQLHADRSTRLNVAILRSGDVFNHKPSSGWFSLDIRSLDAPIITQIETKVRRILDDVSGETGITFTLEPDNMTPGGQIPNALEKPLVRWTTAIARNLGRSAELSDAGSANLNIAIAGGTPSVGLGGERGGQRGFADEWADSDVLIRTAKIVGLLALSVGQALPPPSPMVDE